ncbi:hypothetical protein HWV62_11037 [Athelia sp. TMB]|nr:hypothetical protein HWV62_11037 [Athelia sp. TMB]
MLLAFFIYQYPQLVENLINEWLGLSKEDAIYGTNSDNVINFQADIPKQEAVVNAFKHAWLAYERDAMGDDEYHPISKQGSNLTKAGGIGYTVVDSIDTMLIMGLHDEHARARDWVANKMSFERDANFNTFETTIRVLGGLLAAYHLTGGDPIYLEKARELGERILPTFDDTAHGLPLSQINLALRKGVEDPDTRGLVSTAEVATLQLEFRYLAYLTDEEIFWEKAERVMAVIKQARLPHGLASIFINHEQGKFATSSIRLGSRGDSYYEYLLKQYLQTMYEETMTGIDKNLIQKSASSQMIYTAELNPERDQKGQMGWRLTPKQDHLVCFLGGSLMLGATTTGALVNDVSIPPRAGELTPTGLRDWKTGVELIKTCMHTHETATIPSDNLDKTMPNAPPDWYIKGARADLPAVYDARYILRPETVESLFIAYRLTGDEQYRRDGWKIFQAIEKHCKVESGGYAAIINVDKVPAEKEDKMETFLMSETLKYLYLLFSDASVLPLDQYVFNTEAHPLPVFNPTIRTGFS